MKKYIIRRIITVFIVLIMVSIIVFFLIQIMPGNPYANMMAPNMTKEEAEIMLRKLGYFDPIYIKYFKWLSRVFVGNLGYSIQYGKPVLDVIFSRIGNSFLLAGSAMVISILIGVPLGIITAMKKKSVQNFVVTTFSFVAISIPTFFFGLVLIRFFAIGVDIFGINTKFLPVSNMKDIAKDYTGIENIMDIGRHMILPCITIAIAQSAMITRYVKNSMIEIINSEYIKTAVGKGLSLEKAVWTHGFKNALVPIITILSMQIPILLSGSLIVETIFVWPGIGRLNYDAIMNRDYPLIMGILMIVAIMVLLSNLIADILYVIVDKRIKYEKTT